MATTIYLTNTALGTDMPGGQEDLLADVEVRGAGLTVATKDTSTFRGTMTRDTTGDVALAWWTQPLEAVTISGTVTFNVWMAENNMSANVDAEVEIFRTNGAGELVSYENIVTSAKGTEVPVTTRAAQNWTAAPTSRTLSAGDRILISVYAGDTLAQASGFTCTLGFGATSAGVDGDSWIQFTETIVEQGGGGPAAPHPRRNPYPQLLAH